MKTPQLTHHTNKGARKEILPNRHALNQLAGGDVTQRAVSNYSKVTPGIDVTGKNILGVDPMEPKL